MKKRGGPRGGQGRQSSRRRGGTRLPAEKALRLDAQCTVAQAGAVRTRLAKLFSYPGKVALDGGAVERADTACLQLLAAFIRDRRAANRPVAWRAASAELTGNARLLGLEAVLQTQARLS